MNALRANALVQWLLAFSRQQTLTPQAVDVQRLDLPTGRCTFVPSDCWASHRIRLDWLFACWRTR